MSAPAQNVFEFCRDFPVRPKKTERLFFALMPDEASGLAIADFADRFLGELSGTRVKAGRLHIALHRLWARPGRAVVYGAKLAGQTVAAAGLTLRFDAVGTVGRSLALTSTDKALPAVCDSLGIALKKNGLAARPPATPHIVLACGTAHLPLQAIEPLTVTVMGLALLRRDGVEHFVLRRWPLNKLRTA